MSAIQNLQTFGTIWGVHQNVSVWGGKGERNDGLRLTLFEIKEKHSPRLLWNEYMFINIVYCWKCCILNDRGVVFIVVTKMAVESTSRAFVFIHV